MRPTKFRPAPRPELATRPATAGPYSVRRPGHAPSNSDTNTSPSSRPTTKTKTPSTVTISPKRLVQRPNTSHSSHASQSSHNSPVRNTTRPVASSPRVSPAKVLAKAKSSAYLVSSSPSKADEDFTLVVPTITGLKPQKPSAPALADSSDEDDIATPLRPMKVYEDPFSNTDDHTTPRPVVAAPILAEVPFNEDVSKVVRHENGEDSDKLPLMSPEKFKQNSRLLESGINKIKAKSLDVHAFRKLQGMIRDGKTLISEDKFDELLLGLFEYLESPLSTLSPEKVQDVKAQILATIKLLYKKDRESFRPHVLKGIESILTTRSCYDARAYIVSGLELLADELVTLADPTHTLSTISSQLTSTTLSTLEGCRTLSMGLHILKEILDVKESYTPTAPEVAGMCELAARCLESSESGVRMDAVQLCVSVHERVGETAFWSALGGGVKDDPKSLITYYIVKRQREVAASS